MIANQIAAAVDQARSGTALDNLARILWRGLAEGYVDEIAAEAVSAAIQARRESLGAVRATRAAVAAYVTPSRPRRAPKTPDRQRSLERRRRIAASGAMPPALACRFTLGEVAALSVIARQVQRRGRCCELHIDAIAALSGVSRRTVQNAMRAASRAGIISVMERRRRGAPSLSNVVSIVDASWRTWLRLSRPQGQGANKCAPRNTRSLERLGDCEQLPGKGRAGLKLQSATVRIRPNRTAGEIHGDQIRKCRG